MTDGHAHPTDGRPHATGEPEIVVRADPAAAALAAAERIADALAGAIAARGTAHWATTGGSVAAPIYRALATPPLRDRVDWSRVELWFGDDRFVPRDDPLSNVRPVDEVLLAHGSGVPMRPERVHPVPVDAVLAAGGGPVLAAGGGPVEAARRYAAEIADSLPLDRGRPVFDLVIVGIGRDGHVLSVFPEGSATPGGAASGGFGIVRAIPAPTHVEPHVPRVTLDPAALDVAVAVFAIAFSGSKAPVIGEIFGPVRDVDRWPAQRARRPGAVWFLDEAAAARLPPGVRAGAE